MCIDPVHHVFQHIRIHRQVYSVPGPNSLWHHNGQHGFIDGYSHLITGLRASDNNWGDTVFDLFCHAAQAYGIPLRLHGDHGVENIVVATWMEEN